MNICFLIDTLTNGGAERVVTNLANNFVDHDNNVSIIVFKRLENEYFCKSNVKIIDLNSPTILGNKISRFIKRCSRLRNYIIKNKVDVLVSFMNVANYYCVIATRNTNVKSIISIRNTPEHEYPNIKSRVLAKLLLPIADGCVFQTENAKSWFPKKLQQKSKIIFNPINESFYNVNRLPVEGLVVACGRLERQKNYNMLLKAFFDVVKTDNSVSLHIYGCGSQYNEIVGLVSELGLENNVKLMGRTNNMCDVYRSAQVFVLSSNFEGMPNALMEAMAAGVPCISTDCPCGGPSALNNGEDAMCLVPVNDENEMSRCLKMLLNDSEYRNELSNKGKQRAKAFKVDEISNLWMAYFVEVCNR